MNRADFDRLGAFYLGRECDPQTGALAADPLLYDSRDLTTHAVCVGMTGSGKTGLCIGLIEEAALDGIPALKLTSAAAESEGGFRTRIASALHEHRDPEVDRLRERYAGKLRTPDDRLRRAGERGDVARAGENFGALTAEREALLQQIEREAAELIAVLDPARVELVRSRIAPRKSDLAVAPLALAWEPWRIASDGLPHPAAALEPARPSP